MTKPVSKSVVLGFLTVVEQEGRFRGGYLLLNEFGRPIEFHHTSELTFGRQDRILYGAQFEPFVFAEVIGKPMTERQSTAPQLVLVDRPGLLALRRLIPAPVGLLSGVPGDVWQVHADFPQDRVAFERIQQLVPVGFDWREPFDRLGEALAEIRDPAPIALAG